MTLFHTLISKKIVKGVEMNVWYIKHDIKYSKSNTHNDYKETSMLCIMSKSIIAWEIWKEY